MVVLFPFFKSCCSKLRIRTYLQFGFCLVWFFIVNNFVGQNPYIFTLTLHNNSGVAASTVGTCIDFAVNNCIPKSFVDDYVANLVFRFFSWAFSHWRMCVQNTQQCLERKVDGYLAETK